MFIIRFMDVDRIISYFLEKNNIDVPLSDSKKIIQKLFSREKGNLTAYDVFYILFPSISSLRSPFVFRDMEKSCKRIFKALERGEKILVFGDKDADGIVATFIVVDGLSDIKKFFNSSSEIFYRVPEGEDDYGITGSVVSWAKENNISLIITVDNGISAYDAVKFSKDLGIDMIITDHHELNSEEIFQYAYAVIDPKAEVTEFRELSGAFVAFKLILALYIYMKFSKLELYYVSDVLEDNLEVVRYRYFVPSRMKVDFDHLYESDYVFLFISKDDFFVKVSHKHRDLKKVLKKYMFIQDVYKHFSGRSKNFNQMLEEFGIPDFVDMETKITKLLLSIHLKYERNLIAIVNKYLPLVGITVLSDSMLPIDENRFAVKFALEKIANTEVMGMRYLIGELGVKKDVRLRDLIFSVIPVLNSTGRMGNASIAVDLLLCRDFHICKDITSKILRANLERKSISSEIFNEVFEQVRRENSNILVNTKISKGIVSLIASKLANYFNDKPIFVITKNANNSYTGSARFKNGDVISILREVNHLFINFGGHKRAAGFVISEDRLNDLIYYLQNTDYSMFLEKPEYILDLDIQDFIDRYSRLLICLEPVGNESELLFMARGVIVEDFKNNSYGIVRINNRWFLCDETPENVLNVVGKKVDCLYSYFYRKDRFLDDYFIDIKIVKVLNL